MYLGSFETAYLQREVPEDVVVKSDGHLVVGQMVKLADHTITTLSAGTVSAARDEATHIVAQSDMTMEYGHVPVEDRDYRYSPNVAGTILPTSAVANFLGAYETLQDAPAAAAGNKDKYILVLADGKVYTNTSGTAWAASSTVTAKVKKVALFKIINKDDVIIRENA